MTDSVVDPLFEMVCEMLVPLPFEYPDRFGDEAVAIPMHRGVDSLNVGSAAAAFLYEVSRQRGLS